MFIATSPLKDGRTLLLLGLSAENRRHDLALLRRIQDALGEESLDYATVDWVEVIRQARQQLDARKQQSVPSAEEPH